MAKHIIHDHSSTDMLRLFFSTLAILIICAFEGYSMNHASFPADTSAKPIAIAIHGGAGTIRRSAMTPEAEAEYRAVLTQALQAGHAVLKRGGSARRERRCADCR
jgi:Asparaginase